MRPRVSVLVPARNEQATIAACVESLLAQGNRVNAEILVADDGSTDGTAAEVARLAAPAERLRLLTVPPLPDGWIGKNHAVHFAARHARGEWLLLTDADTIHAPGSLARVLARAESEGIDLFSLSPEQEARAWWEKAVIPRVYRELERLYRYEEINDPVSPAAAANGQYILIRREAYDAAGGHAACRSEILEDVALACAVKQRGGRIRFQSGRGLVRTRMYSSFGAMWEGWTKNLYLLYARRPGAMIAAAARVWALDVFPALLLPRFPVPAAAWLLLRHEQYRRRLAKAGEDGRLAALYWPGSVLFSLLVINSLLRHRTGRPLAWKGRAYSPAAFESQSTS